MEETRKDLEHDEIEFLKEFEEGLEALRSGRARCPAPPLIRAALADLLPEEATGTIRRHLAQCSLCRSLAGDLSNLEFSGPTGEEKRRIDARLRTAIPLRSSPGFWGWVWKPAPIAALASVALALAVWTYSRRPAAEPPATLTSTRERFVPLDKPPVKLPAASVLVWRGESGPEENKVLAALGAALAPYRSDDFAEAARRLERVAREYPRVAEGHFYLGVSLLLLNRSSEAVPALETSKQLAVGPLGEDAAWYLSLAWERAGRRDRAVAEWRSLCSHSGAYQAKACAAAQQPLGK